MAEKVATVGVRKESGWLYYVDKNGDVSRAMMSRGGRKKGRTKSEKVAKVGVQKRVRLPIFRRQKRRRFKS